jgi:hypothetical protein
MTAYARIYCPECSKKGRALTQNSKSATSRHFKEHIIEQHDKDVHKWFREWSGEFFKLNPQYLVYLGVVNDKYEGNAEPAPKMPKVAQTPRKTSDWM